ncbi:Uu.00g051270.m01.CDS01 [Anthostomella pinea]|uniref:Uu.00g051270.m01.CDS01 n=1 Tax=Anthostomella pinea TaxID=933095 RepID=A0AAI8VTN1_9PEZI|nr:Uu.00g051270.m01.CDS01 [Anthostomella pinea]
MASLARFKEPWIKALNSRPAVPYRDLPEYPVSDPASLVCTSRPLSFETGTGASIYTRSLLSAILEAKHEVILVTCFWAPSTTLTALKETLEKLAASRRERIRNQLSAGPGEEAVPPLRIRICFSSRSLLQKIFHTSCRDGYTYPPSAWPTQLGLPDQDTLEAGLIDLRVKSLFFLPFSVMHPKFLIVDRRKARLPSCNVSWEPWLEGCVELDGAAVSTLLSFYQSVWDPRLEEEPAIESNKNPRSNPENLKPCSSGRLGLTSIQSPATRFVSLGASTVPTVLLPSSHRRNPQFRPLFWQNSPSPPSTPLNCAILRLLDLAERQIYLQTPNLTSATVVDALLGALDRGVDVTIVTSRGMMVLEQLLTAGTTTSLCLKSFIKKYSERQRLYAQSRDRRGSEDSNPIIDLEAQPPRLGSLKISYFQSLPASRATKTPEEPVQSHLKLTIVDGQYTVLGSGNMDRASWFTSQELGILFQSTEFATAVSDTVEGALHGRLRPLFSSEA